MSEPTRLCTACRCRSPKASLLRIVREGNEAVVDIRHRKDGRGAYICSNLDCIKIAHKRHSVERSLGIDACADIYVQLENLVRIED